MAQNSYNNNATRPYVLWRRVSTKEQGDSRLGLEAQHTIAVHFLGREPSKIFTDVYSGTKLAECRDLWAAIRHCKQTGDLLVIAKTDRFRDVKEALSILDEVGDGNLVFCDLPTTDRTVLTIVFAIWERQATMGRINTRLALNERKKALAAHGSFVSKSGNVCTHLGAAKGCDMARARIASVQSKRDGAIMWRDSSAAYKMVREWLAMGRARNDMLDELGRLYKHSPQVYCTRGGGPVTRSVLDRWCREMEPALI